MGNVTMIYFAITVSVHAYELSAFIRDEEDIFDLERPELRSALPPE